MPRFGRCALLCSLPAGFGGGREDRLYHGPLRISNDETALAKAGHLYRTKEGKAALSARSPEGVTYVWRCAPASGDFLALIYRTPMREYRVYIYKPVEMREPWRGEPRTVANQIARFAPDPKVTIEQGSAHFIGGGSPLMPPLATPATPLWMQEETLPKDDISQYITPLDLIAEAS